MKEELRSVLNRIDTVADDVGEVIGQHASMVASDEQYDDPELWWAIPMKEWLDDAVVNGNHAMFYLNLIHLDE